VPLIRNLPNLITLGRIVAVPFIVSFLLDSEYTYAFILFFLAGISDAVDGYLAKRFNAHTRLGAYMDPLADKVLITAIFITLGYRGIFEPWLAVLVVSRDLSIVGAILLSSAMGYELEIKAHILSKVNTFVQIFFMTYLLAALGFDFLDPKMVTNGTYIVATTTIVSWLIYLVSWISILGGFEGNGDEEDPQDEGGGEA
jgi:cardiolipin synthase